VTGGSRNAGAKPVGLDVLAPDDIGLTIVEQPSLFWFQSEPADAMFELTLLQEGEVNPLIQVQLHRAASAGIQRLRLSDFGVKLAPGIEYQWVVALVSDPDNRSTDLIASGVIKRVEGSTELKQQISKASPAQHANVYAEAGIWYDALGALSDRLEASPKDASLRQARAELLQQVGLKAAATFDLASAK
jgi:hypothetical protein